MVDLFFFGQRFRVSMSAVLHFPFLYITNGGNDGAGPYYFLMIVIYFAFYLKGKKLYLNIGSLLLFYVLLMLYFYFNPSYIIPYSDEVTKVIDILIAFISITIVMTLIGNTAFRGCNEERNLAIQLASELAEQNKMLENLSIKDQLTNVYNRRYFMKVLKQELQDSVKHKSTFYVLMIDLDHFKRVNDTYGHLYGDNVLLMVAQTIKSSIRAHDVVSRYGGEEFIVLLTHTTKDNGKDVARRIRENIANLRFRNNEGVTVSIGVSKNKKKDNYKAIIKRADDLLYLAKDNGRNRVEY